MRTQKHNLHPGDADYYRYMAMGKKSDLSITSNEENEHVKNDRELMDTAGSSKTKSTRCNESDDDDYVPSNNDDSTSSDDEDELTDEYMGFSKG